MNASGFIDKFRKRLNESLEICHSKFTSCPVNTPTQSSCLFHIGNKQVCPCSKQKENRLKYQSALGWNMLNIQIKKEDHLIAEMVNLLRRW